MVRTGVYVSFKGVAVAVGGHARICNWLCVIVDVSSAALWFVHVYVVALRANIGSNCSSFCVCSVQITISLNVAGVGCDRGIPLV